MEERKNVINPTTTGPIVDVHTHFFPPVFLEEANRNRAWGATVSHRDGVPWVEHDEGFGYPVQEEFLGGSAKFADMDSRGIDRSIMSLSPTLFYYWIDASEAAAFSRMSNDALAEACAASGGRLEGLASLPMQDPDEAAQELRRAVRELGLRGAEIGTNVEGVTLDDPSFQPLWEAAVELAVPLMLHPYYVGVKKGYEDYYLTNIFVNPLDTALAASRLIFSGVLERFTKLDFILVHAGGFLPYQIGRLDHGWKVREEPKARLHRAPSELLDRFYFDTITHNDAALRWLIDFVGSKRVLMGTDLPFDMADADPMGRLHRSASDDERAAIGGANALELFGIKTPA